MITDDLTPLFDRGERAVRFRQGVLTAWDPTNGTNTVDMGGGILTDVPVLNTGEAIALRAGHVVGMLGQGMSWFIVGRITPPNDPSFAGASLAFAAQTGQATNFALATTISPKATCVLDVPAWADEAAVIAVGACVLVNPRTSADFAASVVYIDGDNGPSVQTGFAVGSPVPADNQHVQSMTASHARVFDPAGATITCELQIRSIGAGWGAHATNVAGIAAMAVFRSTT